MCGKSDVWCGWVRRNKVPTHETEGVSVPTVVIPAKAGIQEAMLYEIYSGPPLPRG